jgi:hypothetical protein
MTDDMAEVLAGARQWAVDCEDAAEWLATLPAGCVHAAMCSPPYYALRDYKTGTWEGGDDPACDHKRPVKPSTENVKQPGYQSAFRSGSGYVNNGGS